MKIQYNDKIITSLEAAKQCIDTAIRNIKDNKPFNAALAMYNAKECINSANRITIGE